MNLNNTGCRSVAGLDKALYAIAANYCQSQANTAQTGSTRMGHSHVARTLWWNKKGKMPVDPSQWKYCELCKMTCPGDQVATARFLSTRTSFHPRCGAVQRHGLLEYINIHEDV